jgi:hypothetical protein
MGSILSHYILRMFSVIMLVLLCLVMSDSIQVSILQNPLVLDEIPIISIASILKGLPQALSLGFKGGKAGAFAGFIQVVTLMWLRTVSQSTYIQYTSF